jgi:hypothetical protein
MNGGDAHMKTALKVLAHVWFCFAIAMCVVGGDAWSTLMCVTAYSTVMIPVHVGY